MYTKWPFEYQIVNRLLQIGYRVLPKMNVWDLDPHCICFLVYLEDVVNREDFSSLEMNVFVDRESCMTNLESGIVLLKK